ncbi:MAG: tetratricopeptide repeat protein [Candidatus Theseobacter exili]|nr:tetratricopeptide repeat protein [Candidatus Theseobacter exili]
MKIKLTDWVHKISSKMNFAQQNKKKIIFFITIGIVVISIAGFYGRKALEKQFFADEFLYLMSKAITAENRKDYRKAVSIYEKIIKKYPEKAASAMYSLALLKQKMGAGRPELIKTYEKVLKTYPSHLRATFFLPKLIILWEENGSLIPSCKKFIEQNIDSSLASSALEKTIETLKKKKQYDEVHNLCKTILDKYPESNTAPSALNGLVTYYLSHKKYTEIISLCRETISQYPNTSLAREAQKKMAGAFHFAGKYTEAIKVYEEIISRYPDDKQVPSFMSNLVGLYRKTGNNNQALSYAWKVVEHPEGEVKIGTLKTIKQIGDSFLTARNYQKAMKIYQKIIYSGQLGKLETIFHEKVIGFGENLNALSKETLKQKANFWKTYLSLSFEEDEVSTYERVSKSFPSSLEKTLSSLNVAIDSLSQGNKDKAYQYAILAFESYTKSYPDDERAIQLKEKVMPLFNKKDEDKKEIAQYKEALKINPAGEEAASIYYELGRHYFANYEIEKALRIFAKIVGEFQNTRVAPKAQYAIAKIYGQYMGNKSLARLAYQKLIDQYPNHAFAGVALEQIVETK